MGADIPAEPFHPVFDWIAAAEVEKRNLESIGRDAIRVGSVGAVILSGGQGTRLGFNGPKGVFDIGLESHKSIFQLHIERIDKIRQLSCKEDGTFPSVPVYIMTSDLNHQIIIDFFAQNNYFGYPSADIFFFEQALELCLSKDGKIIVESPTSLALAPDGNGGLFSALESSGALEDIANRGVMHLHAYGIDNVLTKSVDPAFMGLCILNNADCGNKVVPRASKDEKVGVTVLRDGKMFVAEYSELPENIASASDESGKLLFNAANICNHYFNVNFLVETMMPKLDNMYHLAAKKIPYMNADRQTVQPDVVNGYKLELFIFDGFPYADRFTVMSSDRQEEFAPVKNSAEASSDTAATAKAMMTWQAIRWLLKAGANIRWNDPDAADGAGSIDSESFAAAVKTGQVTCEISPLVSYCGEGLEAYAGTTVTLPIRLQ
jgi:UDP-N-acetylglucosamine/UDP-N-acetylgalactosamine diphosphorylase